MSAPKHLLFPVETINRELDYRLAMALMAARKDNRIFIGLHETLMRLASRVRGGVYLGKNAIRPHFPDALDDYQLLKERGFVFVHFDTEGAVYPGAEDRWRQILRQRLDPRHLSSDDFVCTWGDFQRDVYREMEPACVDNIRTTGHPRFDLYGRRWRSYYAADAARLRARYGEFILVNTNLARANNKMGTDFVFSPFNGFRSAELDSRLHTVRDWAYKNEQLSHFVRLVHRLNVVFPDIPIVVRPHPSEDPAFYRLVFQGMSAVHVLHQGAVAPWLLACRCMIHDGCTTGLEAHLGGTDIINFRPIDNPSQDLYLPSLFGVRCTTEDDVVQRLVDLLHGGRQRTAFDDPTLIEHRARRLLHNFRDESFPAMLTILEEAQSQVTETEAPFDLAIRTEETLFETLESVKNLLRPLSPKHRTASAYSRGKFPGFDPDDVSRRIKRLQSIAGCEVKHRVLSRGLMVIEKS